MSKVTVSFSPHLDFLSLTLGRCVPARLFAVALDSIAFHLGLD